MSKIEVGFVPVDGGLIRLIQVLNDAAEQGATDYEVTTVQGSPSKILLTKDISELDKIENLLQTYLRAKEIISGLGGTQIVSGNFQDRRRLGII